MMIVSEIDKTSTIIKKHSYVIDSLSQYWPNKADLILNLPIPQIRQPLEEHLPPQVSLITLPDWAEDIGVEKGLLVPRHFIVTGEGPAWMRIDWLSVIFWYMNGSAERAFEDQYGPIHSYSFRLKGWDSRLWERAWVNRIALFLRRWAAQDLAIDEETLFGSLPTPEIILTHDVDAVSKTLPIRLKQAVFHTFNAVRNFSQGYFNGGRRKLVQAGRFTMSQANYWCFDRIIELEERYGQRSYFNIYGGKGGWRRSIKQILIDPGYTVDDPKLKKQLKQMYAKGWKIGLHQSIDAWADPQRMDAERTHLEQSLDAPVTSCRQHWLRFSWKQTWAAQQEAGFQLDSTLGFNDRPAFRNGAALEFYPWNPDTAQPMKLKAVPMVLMDSQLYDYTDLSSTQRHQQMTYWINEIKAVHGTATIIWHQRVMSEDYGWDTGYETLLSIVGNKKL